MIAVGGLNNHKMKSSLDKLFIKYVIKILVFSPPIVLSFRLPNPILTTGSNGDRVVTTMWEFDTNFLEIIPRTPNIKSFRFATRSKDAPFVSGQFYMVTIRIKGTDALHHISFSGSPTDEYVEFTKRITTSEYSQALNVMKPGDWAHIVGPFGEFTLPDKPQLLCFVTGGIGITPLRSMLRYITGKNLTFNVVLLYSNNTYDDIAFRDELSDMAGSNKNIRVELTLTGADIPADWKGKTGYINQALIRELVPDYGQRLFYISGPTKMVLALQEQIIGIGVPENMIKHDSFTGYD
jgi:glycine betaine catabolism B